MSKLEKKLPSGAHLSYDTPPFNEALVLLEAIMNEIKLLNIELDSEQLSALLNNTINHDSTTLQQLQSLALHLASSGAVLQALSVCARRALYNNKRLIFDEVFEEEQSRADYFFVLYYLAHHSLAPFGRGLAFI
jgi:hypothetical protein